MEVFHGTLHSCQIGHIFSYTDGEICRLLITNKTPVCRVIVNGMN